MKKTAGTVLFCVLLLLSALFLCPLTASAEESGIFTYSVKDGKATIRSVRGGEAVGNFVIPSEIDGYPVTEIGSMVFYDCGELTGITLPSTLTTLGNAAFLGCPALGEITIPEGVTEIPVQAFQDCVSLKKVSLPQSLRKIMNNSFQGCTSLEEFTVPSGVTRVGACFKNCTSLRKLTLPSVGEELTGYSSDGLGTLFCGNQSDVPPSLKEVVVTGGKKIGRNFFQNCVSLERISLPATVTDVETDAFSGCLSLKELTVDAGNRAFQSKNNCLIRTATKELLVACDPEGIPTDGSVKIICANVFPDPESVTSVTVPDSVTKINTGAFRWCTSLESISLPFVGETAGGANHNAFGWIFSTSANDYVPKSLKHVTVTGNCPIAEEAFHDCHSLETFTATGKISSVGIFAFINCESLKTVDFRGGVNEIKQSAFLKCRSLEEIFLPDTLTGIGKKIFEGCGEVTVVCFSGSGAHRYAEKNGIRYRLIDPVAAETEPVTETEPVAETEPIETEPPKETEAPEETESVIETEPPEETEIPKETEAEQKNKPMNDSVLLTVAIALPVAAAILFLLCVRGKKR